MRLLLNLGEDESLQLIAPPLKCIELPQAELPMIPLSVMVGEELMAQMPPPTNLFQGP